MKRKVAIYARVSTEHEAQISALENQVQYYDEILNRQPDLELYDRYIDEGITGTSINKRPNFMRMMEDAKSGCFDLIITREVSRFARNTVDTLQQTRILKAYNVEVWFIEDNIWTIQDEDSELRLSIMATLAQNESKKISSRVKAGQKISFMNGVLYGNGNILGYDRVGKEFVINKEQADTVKRIFELYDQGNGARKIQFILEQECRKTAMGKTNWSASVILKILKNPFYCGRIEYRKQFVPDYLTQKKINNHGEVEKIIVKGNHPPIISEELFDRIQERLKNSCQVKNGVKYGKPLADNIWVQKVVCKCGHTMNRRINYVSKATNKKTYTFQCYHQLRTGSIKTREKRGLSTEGICDNTSFPQWKLELQADFIFRKLLCNKQGIFDIAMKTIETCISSELDTSELVKKIRNATDEIDKLKRRQDVLLDMCTSGDISRERFKEKNQSLQNQIDILENTIRETKDEIKRTESSREKDDRIKVLSEFIKMRAFSKDEGIPEYIIKYYVDQIVVDKGIFTWRLNPELGNMQFIKFNMKHTNKKSLVPDEVLCYNDDTQQTMIGKTMCHDDCNTGCNQHDTLVKNPLFLGTYRIPKSYMKSVIGFYHKDSEFRFPSEMEIKLEVV